MCVINLEVAVVCLVQESGSKSEKKHRKHRDKDDSDSMIDRKHRDKDDDCVAERKHRVDGDKLKTVHKEKSKTKKKEQTGLNDLEEFLGPHDHRHGEPYESF